MSEIVALGAGRMGRGIAHAFAYAGHNVRIVDFKERRAADAAGLLEEAKSEVAENLELLKSLGMVNDRAIEATLGRIDVVPLDDAGTVLAQADYIFEGVPETLPAKEDALHRASEMAGPNAVIASTSSTMLANDLAAFSTVPKNFLNAHFLNPAYLIPLVEVSPSEQTDPRVLSDFGDFLTSIGKVPVVCRNAPGYIVARLQSLVMNESLRMVEEGVASPEEIDRAVRNGFGLRYATMGPVEFTDWGGVDILYYADKYLSGVLGERFAAPPILDRYIEEGKLGLKTGQGFYDFNDIDVDAYRREKLGTFIDLLTHMNLLPTFADDQVV